MTISRLKEICDENDYCFECLELCLKKDSINIDDIYISIFYTIIYKYRKFVLVDESIYDTQVSNIINQIASYNKSCRDIGEFDFKILCNICKVKNKNDLIKIIKMDLEDKQKHLLNIIKVIHNHLEKLVKEKYRTSIYNLLCVLIDAEYKYTEDEAINYVQNCVGYPNATKK